MKKMLQFALMAATVAVLPSLMAQIPSGYVQTTATVPALANGQFGASWTNLSSSPQLGLLGCVSTFQTTVNGVLDSNGHFSTLLADTSQICPSPSTWTFTFTFECIGSATNGAFQVAIPVTGGGGTEDISAQVTAALPTNPCGGGGGGGSQYVSKIITIPQTMVGQLIAPSFATGAASTGKIVSWQGTSIGTSADTDLTSALQTILNGLPSGSTLNLTGGWDIGQVTVPSNIVIDATNAVFYPNIHTATGGVLTVNGGANITLRGGNWKAGTYTPMTTIPTGTFADVVGIGVENGASNVLISGPAFNNLYGVVNVYNSSNVRVTGTIGHNNDGGIQAVASTTSINSITFDHNFLYGNADDAYGLFTTAGSGSLTFTNSAVTDNYKDGIGLSGTPSSCIRVGDYGDGLGAISGIHVDRNKCVSLNGPGIIVFNTTNSTVSDNQVIGYDLATSGAAITLGLSSSNPASYLVVSGNQVTNPSVSFTDQGLVAGNLSHSVLSGNHIAASSTNSINLQDSTYNTVVNNELVCASCVSVQENGTSDYNLVANNNITGTSGLGLGGTHTNAYSNLGYSNFSNSFAQYFMLENAIGQLLPSTLVYNTYTKGVATFQDWCASYDCGQFGIVGKTNTNQQLVFGYDTTNNFGYIQANLAGTAEKPLWLNKLGGVVNFGGAGLNAPLFTFATGAACDWAQTTADTFSCILAHDSGSGLTMYSSGFAQFGSSGGSAEFGVSGGSSDANILNGGTGDINIYTRALGGKINIDVYGNGTTFGGPVQMKAITGHGNKGPICTDTSGNLYVGSNSGGGAPCP